MENSLLMNYIVVTRQPTIHYRFIAFTNLFQDLKVILKQKISLLLSGRVLYWVKHLS